jgi:ubiquinone/menaquinone biosynthesis C-methylase UbiE
MSRAVKRGISFAVVVAAALLALAAVYVPYLPVVHGSDPDEAERIAAWLRAGPGTHVADLGAGDGRFAFALAETVGPVGHVYATEISAERLTEMRRAIADRGLENVSVIEGATDRTHLPEGCCDAVFTRNVYHHLSDPAAINADIHRALRPDGLLLVIDFPPGGLLDRIAPADAAARHGGHGAPPETVRDEVIHAGFELLRGPEPWRGRLYALMFRKVDADGDPGGSAAGAAVAATPGLEALESLRSPAPDGAKLYFITPQHGDTVPTTFTVRFGLSGMGVAPAGVDMEHTGHHHLLINVDELPPLNLPLPATEQFVHYGTGQTETTITLEPGEHTLQLVLGNHLHIPHDPPVMSEKITVTVAAPD